MDRGDSCFGHNLLEQRGVLLGDAVVDLFRSLLIRDSHSQRSLHSSKKLSIHHADGCRGMITGNRLISRNTNMTKDNQPTTKKPIKYPPSVDLTIFSLSPFVKLDEGHAAVSFQNVAFDDRAELCDK